MASCQKKKFPSECRERFADMDKNDDKFIDKAEIEERMRQFGGGRSGGGRPGGGEGGFGGRGRGEGGRGEGGRGEGGRGGGERRRPSH